MRCKLLRFDLIPYCLAHSSPCPLGLQRSSLRSHPILLGAPISVPSAPLCVLCVMFCLSFLPPLPLASPWHLLCTRRLCALCVSGYSPWNVSPLPFLSSGFAVGVSMASALRSPPPRPLSFSVFSVECFAFAFGSFRLCRWRLHGICFALAASAPSAFLCVLCVMFCFCFVFCFAFILSFVSCFIFLAGLRLAWRPTSPLMLDSE